VKAHGDQGPRLGRLRGLVGQAAQRVACWAARVPDIGSKPALRPLTAEFRADQHQAYVDHLNAVLGYDGVRNIALTGRYGAGKSSVLQEFARQNRERVLFLSLSTLGPENPDESRTNQIQKELVKQLLHREKPARLQQSRYQRIDRLPLHRALAESAAGIVALGVVLWLFGLFPPYPRADRRRTPVGSRSRWRARRRSGCWPHRLDTARGPQPARGRTGICRRRVRHACQEVRELLRPVLGRDRLLLRVTPQHRRRRVRGPSTATALG
jgi:hypothetical protein